MTSKSSTPWAFDPIERARYLDGECSAEEMAVREGDLAKDPAARSRVEREAEFLAVVRRGALGAAVPPSEFFAARLRNALAEDKASGFPPAPQLTLPRRELRRRIAVAVAAGIIVVVGAGLWMSGSGAPTVSAAGREAIIAAETYRQATRDGIPAEVESHGSACADADASSPRGFPPLQKGELELAACSPRDAGGPGSVSILRGSHDSKDGRDPRGLVVVPWDGKTTSTDVGYTRVGENLDVVVFDVSIGRAKYFLATRWETVAGTASCAACHGPSRAGIPALNPHTFVDRTIESR